MTQQTTANKFKDVAADATNTATEFGKQAAERVVGSVKEAGAKAANLAPDKQKALGDNLEDFSKRLQGVSTFNQHTLEAFAKSSEIAGKAFEGIGRESPPTPRRPSRSVSPPPRTLPRRKHCRNCSRSRRVRAECVRRLGAAGVQDERNIYCCRQGHRRADR